MPDAGEIKAKVTIEYDGSGVKQAKEDLASLADAGGTSEAALSGTNDALAQLEQQASSTAESTKALTSGIGELPKQLDGMVTGVQEVSNALGEGQGAIESAGSAFEALQAPLGTSVEMLAEAAPPMQLIAEHAQSMNEQLAPVADNVAQLSDSLSQSVPMLPQFAESLHPVAEQLQALNEQVTQTASAFQGISFTDESGNMVTLPEGMKLAFNDAGNVIGPAAAYIQDQLNGVNSSASQTSSAFNLADGSINKTSETLLSVSDNAGKTASGFTAINEAATQTNKTLDETNVAVAATGNAIEEAGNAGGKGGFLSGLFSDTGQAEWLFGAGGMMGMLSDIMMPLYALQMIPMMVSGVGQSIYGAAAIAEGPAAHSFGTFTGAIDTLNASAAKSGEVFSESFGQGLLPALNGMNNASQNSDNGFLGQLGQGLGMEAGIAGDFLQIIGGGIVGGAAKILTLNPNNQFGQDWINSGTQGLANYWANWTGQPQPYPGPEPPNQAQTYYQQQVANLPNTIQMSTAQLNSQAATTLAEAADPNWEAAYNQASASQKAAQYLISNYQSRHPISQADLIQQAQYDAYAAQQEENYAYQMGGGYAPGVPGPGGGYVSAQAQQSSPLDFLTGFGPASVAGYEGTGGQTYGQEIGQGIQDFFSGGGGGGLKTSVVGSMLGIPGFGVSGPDLMQFLTGFGATNVGAGGGPTYGSMIGGAINQGWDNTMGFLGSVFNGSIFGGGGTNPQPFQTAGGCFVAGTPIRMADGNEEPIETLRIGDRVRTHDGIQRITDTITYPAKQTYTLTFSDGNVLTLTDSHPIATKLGWKSIDPASTKRENSDLSVTPLHIGDIIHTIDGLCDLISIQTREITQVYNITVATSHTYYASKILVHNAKGLTDSGTGTEQVSLSHTFTANVTWAANNLEKSFTAAAQWAEQGLVHAATAVANWAEQGLEHMATAIATWAEQGLMHEATAVAQWAEQGLQHMATAVAQWAEQDLIHPVVATAQWAEQGISHLFTGVASWVGQGLEHTFNAVAQWTAQNLTPNFTVNPSVTMLAEGTSNWPGGPAVVGEAGTEVVAHNGQYSLFDQGAALVNLPAGASVYPMKNLSYAPSTPAQFADGLGDGSIIPINLGFMNGGSSSMPQSINLTLQIGDAIFSQMGIPMAQNMRLVAGYRGY